MEIYNQLSLIQNEVKVPKNQHNKFGGYNYRNAEDILEAVKPVCAKHNTTLIITDEIVLIGERYYVKATATLFNKDGESVFTNAYAREEENKKGMDSSQLTGSTSSYARKYALNGLFNIDDTKDSDFNNKHGKEETPKNPKLNSGKIQGNNETETMDNVWKKETIKQKETLDKSFAKAVNIPYASKVKEIVCKSMGWKNWDTDFAITSKDDMLNIPQKCKNEIEKLKAIDNSGL